MIVRRNFLVTLVLLALFPILASGGRAQSTTRGITREWTVEGVKRTALIFLPSRPSEQPAPVVFAFHGHGGNSAQAARSFHIQDEWPEAIVIYMQGLKSPGKLTDPAGILPGWQFAPGDLGDRDLKFFDAVWSSVKSDYKIDEKHVFCTGHSNGGSFTFLLWATRGELFEAVAPSGSVASSVSRKLTPKPMLHLAGENDPLVKFSWQKQSMEFVKRLNSCDPTGTAWVKMGNLTGTWFNSSTRTPLVTLLYPGGHRFPAEAPGVIVRFFQEIRGGKTANK